MRKYLASSKSKIVIELLINSHQLKKAIKLKKALMKNDL
jgi:hypothetical protein